MPVVQNLKPKRKRIKKKKGLTPPTAMMMMIPIKPVRILP
jgi:hypothetical protein